MTDNSTGRKTRTTRVRVDRDTHVDVTRTTERGVSPYGLHVHSDAGWSSAYLSEAQAARIAKALTRT